MRPCNNTVTKRVHTAHALASMLPALDPAPELVLPKPLHDDSRLSLEVDVLELASIDCARVVDKLAVEVVFLDLHLTSAHARYPGNMTPSTSVGLRDGTNSRDIVDRETD